jgi:osmotically inducible protein OsmC
MKRAATAVWTGPLKAGKGVLTTDSKTLSDTPYSFTSRFESGGGTNPEELIAAAHAGCFSMAFGFALEQAGIENQGIETKAVVTLDTSAGPAITESALTTTARVAGADHAKVREIAEQAKAGCPVSKALGAIRITLDLTVV